MLAAQPRRGVNVHAVRNGAPRGERARRAMLVLLIAVFAGWFTWLIANPAYYVTDFQYLWHGARLWTRGIDPYSMRPGSSAAHLWPLWDRLFYPLPALLVVAPFSLLALRLAQVAF